MVTPVNRIERVKRSWLLESYEKKASYLRFEMQEKFQILYENSNLRSVEPFANIAGISTSQARRIMEGICLPDAETLQRAATNLCGVFGMPRVSPQVVHAKKLRIAVPAVLDVLSTEVASLPQSDKQRVVQEVADMCNAVAPPTHLEMRCPSAYQEWIRGLVMRYPAVGHEVADATGVFLTAREYLPGFIERLEKAAISLSKTDASGKYDSDPFAMLVGMIRGIRHALGIIQAYRENWTKVGQSLLHKVQMEDYQVPRSCSKEFVKELVGRWGLHIDDFFKEGVTTGYLVMEGANTREIALTVLSNIKNMR